MPVFPFCSVTMSKTFDNGMICASEQVLVAESKMMDEILTEFKAQGSYLLSKEEAEKIAGVIFTPSKATPGAFQMTPASVGQSAHRLPAGPLMRCPGVHTCCSTACAAASAA